MFYGSHLMDGITPICKLCERRVPPALSASGCERNSIDTEAFARLFTLAASGIMNEIHELKTAKVPE